MKVVNITEFPLYLSYGNTRLETGKSSRELALATVFDPEFRKQLNKGFIAYTLSHDEKSELRGLVAGSGKNTKPKSKPVKAPETKPVPAPVPVAETKPEPAPEPETDAGFKSAVRSQMKQELGKPKSIADLMAANAGAAVVEVGVKPEALNEVVAFMDKGTAFENPK